jgi:hypothetical protein
MPQEKEAGAGAACPFCAFWTALKHSEAGQHLRQIERETLLLARSVVGSCLRTAERYASRPAESSGENRV